MSKLQQENRLYELTSKLERLIADAERISRKFGDLDYQEWLDLSRSVQQAKNVVQKYGFCERGKNG